MQSECISCQKAEMKGACFVKFTVYLVKCNLCGAVLVTLNLLYTYMSTHGNDNISDFKWKILTAERLKSTRLAKEFIH